MGNAITNTPQIQHTDPITFPSGVVGQISPYFKFMNGLKL